MSGVEAFAHEFEVVGAVGGGPADGVGEGASVLASALFCFQEERQSYFSMISGAH